MLFTKILGDRESIVPYFEKVKQINTWLLWSKLKLTLQLNSISKIIIDKLALNPFKSSDHAKPSATPSYQYQKRRPTFSKKTACTAD
jgi:hypothetical protein